MAFKDPYCDWGYIASKLGQRVTMEFTLRNSSGEKIHTWDGVGVTFLSHESAYKLHVAGDPLIWLNNGARKRNVQLNLYDHTWSSYRPVIVFKPVRIAVGECFVFLNPNYLYTVTHDSTKIRGNGVS